MGILIREFGFPSTLQVSIPFLPFRSRIIAFSLFVNTKGRLAGVQLGLKYLSAPTLAARISAENPGCKTPESLNSRRHEPFARNFHRRTRASFPKSGRFPAPHAKCQEKVSQFGHLGNQATFKKTNIGVIASILWVNL